MKVSVLGNIIDTEDIYMITKVMEDLNNYSFEIKFFNHKEFTVSTYYHNVYDSSKNSKENNELKKEKVSKLRDELIKLWSNNQSDILKLEFTKYDGESK